MNALAAIQTTTVPTSVGPVWNVRKRNTPTAWSYQAIVYEPAPPPPGKGLLPVWRERERLGKPAPITEDADEVGKASGLPRDYFVHSGEPVLNEATIYAALGATLGPAEEAAWRLGADYKVVVMERVISNKKRSILAIARGGRQITTKKRGRILFGGHLICRLGTFQPALVTPFALNYIPNYTVDHLPPTAEPERTPAEEVAHAAAKKNPCLSGSHT